MVLDKKYSVHGLICCLVMLLVGCVGTVQVPLNERSHIELQANPLKEKFELSYNLYERSHKTTYTFDAKPKHWIDIRGLGRLYSEDRSYSPAAKRIEKNLAKITENGNISSDRALSVLAEEVFYTTPSSKRTPQPRVETGKESFIKRVRQTLLPLAQLLSPQK
jgi:hypothetical protein